MAFIRVKWIKSGNSKRPYSYLVESIWEDGKVKQKTLKYLGPGDLRTSTSKQELGTRTQKLGTTESKIKFHFDKINKETRAGNMVRIPELWRKVKKEGISRKEFEKTLYKLEKERKIDLQVASATYVIKPEDKKLGMPHSTRGHINYVVWRKPPKKKTRAKMKHDKYACNLCGKQFQNKTTLSWHLKDNHMYVGKLAKENMVELEEWS